MAVDTTAHCQRRRRTLGLVPAGPSNLLAEFKKEIGPFSFTLGDLARLTDMGDASRQEWFESIERSTDAAVHQSEDSGTTEPEIISANRWRELYSFLCRVPSIDHLSKLVGTDDLLQIPLSLLTTWMFLGNNKGWIGSSALEWDLDEVTKITVSPIIRSARAYKLSSIACPNRSRTITVWIGGKVMAVIQLLGKEYEDCVRVRGARNEWFILMARIWPSPDAAPIRASLRSNCQEPDLYGTGPLPFAEGAGLLFTYRTYPIFCLSRSNNNPIPLRSHIPHSSFPGLTPFQEKPLFQLMISPFQGNEKQYCAYIQIVCLTPRVSCSRRNGHDKQFIRKQCCFKCS